MICHANAAQSERPSVATAFAGGPLMDAGCYTIHFQRTIAGAEPCHDGGVEPLRPSWGRRIVVRSDSRRAVGFPATAGPHMPVSCRHSPAPSCGANLCSPDQTPRSPTCRLSTRGTPRLGNRGENLANDGSALLRTAADEKVEVTIGRAWGHTDLALALQVGQVRLTHLWWAVDPGPYGGQ